MIWTPYPDPQYGEWTEVSGFVAVVRPSGAWEIFKKDGGPPDPMCSMMNSIKGVDVEQAKEETLLAIQRIIHNT